MPSELPGGPASKPFCVRCTGFGRNLKNTNLPCDLCNGTGKASVKTDKCNVCGGVATHWWNVGEQWFSMCAQFDCTYELLHRIKAAGAKVDSPEQAP